MEPQEEQENETWGLALTLVCLAEWVRNLIPGSLLALFNLMKIHKLISMNQNQIILTSLRDWLNHMCLNQDLSYQFSNWPYISLMPANRVASFHRSEDYSALGKWTNVGLTWLSTESCFILENKISFVLSSDTSEIKWATKTQHLKLSGDP